MSGGNVVPPLTTHVLDTARGIPGGGISMVLLIQTGNGEFREIERGTTTNDGRGGFLSSSSLQAGAVYKLFFDTDCYFKSIGVKGFYPYVEVVFRIEDPSQHYHVPLLLSPYGYSTYRGSWLSSSSLTNHCDTLYPIIDDLIPIIFIIIKKCLG